MERICVFCGASSGRGEKYLGVARAMGRALARRRLGLVYGGGRLGLMGALADAALGAGGRVIGVIPEGMVERERAHGGVTELRVVSSMHERKALMAELSDGFAALPGGLGTLEELAEILTWSQLGLHRKPCGLVAGTGYFDRLIEHFDHAVAEGFVRPAHRALLLAAPTPDALLDAFEEHRPPTLPRWLGENEI